ncbi:putative selenate reductase subunit YgfK, partial [bacterium]|nr:putative selenate reductase subunit YgfK [bacterium]
LLKWVLAEYSKSGSIFNIPSQLFYRPTQSTVFSSEIFGSHLTSPVGPAAGPHTQLAQNIISSWLTGSRFIELKTVQIMDELDIPRPCIDMTDEGYNVEWSQELKLRQSGLEYVHAWIMIHILRRILHMENTPFGTVFNMSIGYNLEGITSEPMLNFINLMKNASDEIDRIREYLKAEYPAFADIEIPTEISNNVTLSTMHGCPPDEIQRIGEYLLNEQQLHTIIKMNPTLLGRDAVFDILHGALGFDYIDIPQKVFDADTDWETALKLIKSLENTANQKNLHFGVKLSNTLAMRNVLQRLPGEDIYMSGRALCPVTVNLFLKLQEAFDYRLKVSYSGGADATNISSIISAGALPVTVASDLLKPGGYCRTTQYLENLEQAMLDSNSGNLTEFQANARKHLPELAAKVLEDPWYKIDRRRNGLPKLSSALPVFDCITAPCTETCPAKQSPPAYIRRIAKNELDAAFRSILKQNPLPGMTGYICPNTCQFKCTRNLYDEPVAIRQLKRYVRDNVIFPPPINAISDTTVAIVGAGPAGLSAAAFLAETGIRVTIFEASSRAGGVPAIAPTFRIPEDIIKSDVTRIIDLGVEIKLNHPINDPPQTLLDQGFDAVFFSPGFKNDLMLDIPGADGPGVIGVMEFLAQVSKGETFSGFKKVLVLGGGNTAVDAARTASRLIGKPCPVVYRRTIQEMPAWQEEIKDLLEEGNSIIDLTTPVKINRRGKKILSLTCLKNKLGELDASGRPRPEAIPGSEHKIKADLIIIAFGQEPDFNSGENSGIVIGKKGEIVVNEETGETGCKNIFAGGDAVRGPSYIIQAAADGHRAALAIALELGMDATTELSGIRQLEPDWESINVARTHLIIAQQPKHLPVDKRAGFDLIEDSFTDKQAIEEAQRCMQCDVICDRCVDVCPNRANIPIQILPRSATVSRIKLDNNDCPVVAEFDFFMFRQERQVIHLDEFCNACGNCSVFCTHDGEPFITKPLFFLNRKNFENSTENSWYINEFEMIRRLDGRLYHLVPEDGGYNVHIGDLIVKMNHNFVIENISGSMSGMTELSMVPAAEMIVFMESLSDHPVSMGR